jgi:hypothetical protein
VENLGIPLPAQLTKQQVFFCTLIIRFRQNHY